MISVLYIDVLSSKMSNIYMWQSIDIFESNENVIFFDLLR
jgi:hypothetical protein